ncbi:MAG: hypothetical protein KDC87_03900 [Planctomycetes bacterium]|nr:hypothetical protein [Planctomycetota bacterium]MCB9869867.1 hypothetical protein [Planctomycetota bacterium]MCB9889097.1 hypothetical protein [Planctomycetota bacterium]
MSVRVPGTGMIRGWMVLPLVAAALWVNRAPLLRWLNLDQSAQQAPVRVELYRPETRDTPAAPLGAVASFAPVRGDETIADPMLHGVAPRPLVETEQSAKRKLIEPPVITLILHGAASKRALIDGQILGIGDATRLGEIVAIEAAEVRVRTRAGQIHVLRLTTAPRPGPGDKNSNEPPR